MIRDRVMAGLDRARASGKRLGRPRTTPFQIGRIRAALDEGRGVRETARLLKVVAGQGVRGEAHVGNHRRSASLILCRTPQRTRGRRAFTAYAGTGGSPSSPISFMLAFATASAAASSTMMIRSHHQPVHFVYRTGILCETVPAQDQQKWQPSISANRPIGCVSSGAERKSGDPPTPPRKPLLSNSLPVFSMSIIGSTVVGVRAEPTRKLWNASPTIICQP